MAINTLGVIYTLKSVDGDIVDLAKLSGYVMLPLAELMVAMTAIKVFLTLVSVINFR